MRCITRCSEFLVVNAINYSLWLTITADMSAFIVQQTQNIYLGKCPSVLKQILQGKVLMKIDSVFPSGLGCNEYKWVFTGYIANICCTIYQRVKADHLNAVCIQEI